MGEDNTNNKKIPLVEVFGPTVQGEGEVIGQQTYFLRFGLCDYRCTMCDSMHAVDPTLVMANSRRLTQKEIFDALQEIYLPHSTRWVTFSGGNPCIHDLDFLVDLLHDADWKISVETQGTLAPDWLRKVDHITCSPKGPGMGEVCDMETLHAFVKHCEWPNFPLAMKIVVFDQRDLEFAKEVYTQFHERNVTWYLSLGNPNPPKYDDNAKPNTNQPTYPEVLLEAIERYKMLFEDIKGDPFLSKFKYLPQWHWFVWGNEKGR